MSAHPSDSRSPFTPTIWEQVRSAGAGSGDAIGRLYIQYRCPLRTYLLYKFRLPEVTAEELVHDFLSQKLATCAARADAQKGKFRNLLLTALVNHVRDWFRGHPPAPPVSLDDSDVAALPAPLEETEVELEWTRLVVAETLRRVKEFYESRNKPAFWVAFDGRIVQPLLEETKPIALGELVAKHGFESPQAVSNALVDGKRKFVKYLEEVVTEYAGDSQSVETEVRQLKAFLARSS